MSHLLYRMCESVFPTRKRLRLDGIVVQASSWRVVLIQFLSIESMVQLFTYHKVCLNQLLHDTAGKNRDFRNWETNNQNLKIPVLKNIFFKEILEKYFCIKFLKKQQHNKRFSGQTGYAIKTGLWIRFCSTPPLREKIYFELVTEEISCR